MSKERKAIDKLRNLMGEHSVITEHSQCYRAAMDNARLPFLPEAVLKPKIDNHIGSILRLANAYKIPITTRGAGTATTGATSPVKGGWVLDLSSWEKIQVDEEQGFAHVEAGAKTAEIHKLVEQLGWFYPPDPSSKKYSTIGGNIATNAGGLRGAKYGVTRDYVLALEGFMPNGDFVKWGAPLRKFASGYNLRDLWIGSEGTLGVVVRATLRLLPKPKAKHTYLLGFFDEKSALNIVKQILAARLLPSVMEFLDRQTVACALNYMNNCAEIHGHIEDLSLKKVVNSFVTPPSLLLIEFDGEEAAIKANGTLLKAIIDDNDLVWQKAEDEDAAEELWRIRRTCSQAMFKMGNTKLNEDVVVPLRHYHELLDFTLQLKTATGLATPTFGHAADGNFHVHLMYDNDNAKQSQQARKGLQNLMKKVVELDGAITGEHGIGLTKSSFLNLQHSPEEIKVMQDLKKLFDPNDILNPGKIFTPFEMWEKKRDYDIVFPWDV